MNTRERVDLQTRLAERFRQDAEAYRELWAPVLRPHAVDLLDRLALQRSARVLDLGTGVGTLLPEIRARADEGFVAGIDRSEGMIALAPRGEALAVMDAGRLAFRSHVFDRVIAAFVIQFLVDPVEGLREAHRVLRPGGWLGTATWGRDASCRAYDVWQEELDARGAGEAEELIANHDLVDSPEKVRVLLERTDFGSIKTWTGRLDNRMDPEGFLACRTRLSLSKRRFETLAPDARTECLARVRERLTTLPPEDLVERDEIVFAAATKAG